MSLHGAARPGPRDRPSARRACLAAAAVLALAVAGCTSARHRDEPAAQRVSVEQVGAVDAPAGASPTPSAAKASPSHSPGARALPPASPHGLHYISNTGDAWPKAAALGYNLVDMGADRETVDALPAGVRALVWLGSLDNTDCVPRYSWTEFTRAVDRMAGDPKVFGYYLSDEPHPDVCPSAASDIRARADYIHAHDPGRPAFIVVLSPSSRCPTDHGCEYDQLRPAVTHVDLVGVDMFPCHVGAACAVSEIDERVGLAVSNGIPRSAIVPVFQAFGQACTGSSAYYRLPTTSEMRAMLARWRSLVPHPVFDFTYTWRSGGSACPALDAANGAGGNADLQSVLRAHNTG